MSDLVERLRRMAEIATSALYSQRRTIHEAADEIERLQRELARRRAEDEAALLFFRKMTEIVPIRDVIRATGTVGDLIGYFSECVEANGRASEARDGRDAKLHSLTVENAQLKTGKDYWEKEAKAVRAKAEERERS